VHDYKSTLPVSNRESIASQRPDISEARQRLPLPALLHRLGLGDCAKKSARCPFHDDQHNSFSVWRTANGRWLFNCFVGCGEGDEINFLELRHGISRSDAVKLYLEMAGIVPQPETETGPHGRSQPEPVVPYILSSDECWRAIQMAECLRENLDLCARIAAARGWKPDTIRSLTWGPHLGWHDQKLAFIYESGVKLRWRENGERRFMFAFGKAHSLWRSAVVVPETRKIFVFEGETDAISAIDAGIEDDRLKSVVVALPSSTIMCPEWGPLFSGREAILCFDADVDGQRAVQKFAVIVAHYATKIWKLRWDQNQAA